MFAGCRDADAFTLQIATNRKEWRRKGESMKRALQAALPTSTVCLSESIQRMISENLNYVQVPIDQKKVSSSLF